ncbi:cytochrome b561 and DOMON domain-containing protein At5g35735-like [Andrographis paniculata]|uniref:cytochrome b561 and DOMON domain-containing protein At5g35735-like n=1 Tax=Andrographis paniculata TaxID=175694 RepID=UPI0021E74F47|nr:cytochrome b561 and DOMON domain-containing protein At5g35735-like [Andrographis paniculata]
MASSPYLSLLTSVFGLLLLSLLVDARSCTKEYLAEISKFNIIQHCDAKSLGTEFGWNFDNGTNRLDIAFAARLDTETAWLAWGLNLEAPRMVGTRALIGIKHRDRPLDWGKYNITKATIRGCRLQQSGDIGLDVRNFTFVYLERIKYYAIHATIFLPKEHNSSNTHIVWQVGAAAAGKEPQMHSIALDNLDSAETVDLVSNHTKGYTIHVRHRLRTVHGALNIIGWGTLLPVGVIIARYTRKYPLKCPSWWFTLHVGCQIAGYIIGVIGWSIGICLGAFSKYYCFLTHRILAIIIFTFATIQMMALRLKPNRYDEYRTYWNMYHHSLGYVLLALMAVNIFEGIKIVQQNQAWKWAYVGVLAALGFIALAFEIFTWIKFVYYRFHGGLLRRRGDTDSQPSAVGPQPTESPIQSSSK